VEGFDAEAGRRVTDGALKLRRSATAKAEKKADRIQGRRYRVVRVNGAHDDLATWAAMIEKRARRLTRSGAVFRC
jgi:hypothetical protein